MRLRLLPTLILALTGTFPAWAQQPDTAFVREANVAVAMRDGVVLRADVWRPSGPGRFPALVYRTPYGKQDAVQDYTTFRRAVERGYAVVIQDVRGRGASLGEFNPYRNEGRDGYDTIEWAARQPWSNGAVGTFGLSYPGAVQWLAAVENPPHLKAMVPAMVFATPRTFFYTNGVWDLSWIGWIWYNIAPEVRAAKNLPGPRTTDQADSEWNRVRGRLLGQLPLSDLPDFHEVAPWYYEWLAHPPAGSWWDWAELRGKYRKVHAAVLNLSGWHDEAYGPSGAIRNFQGLVEARRGHPANTQMVIGPWAHGVAGTGRTMVGDREMGSNARIDYDELILRWMDHYVRGLDNGVDREKPVRVFVMGENRWRESDVWPLAGERSLSFYLSGRDSTSPHGSLSAQPPTQSSVGPSSFISDPARPLIDPFAERSGAHDYRALAGREDLLTFETVPLVQDLEVVGAMTAEIYLSTEGRDTDLWVRVLDVAPDGTAYNLMNPGLDVLRASYRDGTLAPKLLTPGRVYHLRLSELLTGNLFRRGHRIRIQISAAFFPGFSRNLNTGESEVTSNVMQTARVSLYHDREHPSRIVLPVVSVGD